MLHGNRRRPSALAMFFDDMTRPEQEDAFRESSLRKLLFPEFHICARTKMRQKSKRPKKFDWVCCCFVLRSGDMVGRIRTLDDICHILVSESVCGGGIMRIGTAARFDETLE